MEIISKIPLKGHLSIYKKYKDGTEEMVFEEEPNLITLLAKGVVLQSVYLGTLTADPVTTLQVGTGGTIDPAGLYPKAPLNTIAALYTYLLSVPTSYTVNAAVPSVTFLATLDEGTGNGSLINEAGLFKSSGIIFNIKTFPGIPKTSEFSLYFNWTIQIA